MRKRMVILGGGESGAGAALLANMHGYDVFLSDNGSLKDIYKQELEANNISFEDKQKIRGLLNKPSNPDMTTERYSTLLLWLQ